MTTYFLTREFSPDDMPDCVSQDHLDNFQAALRQRDVADDARLDALDLERQIGPEPRGADKRRLQDIRMRCHYEQETYDAMVQEAMEDLTNEYPYGFGDHT